MLLWSDVRRDVGRDSVGAREARGGEPQSSSVCRSPVPILIKLVPCERGGDEPGRRDIREYWYVHSRSTG